MLICFVIVLAVVWAYVMTGLVERKTDGRMSERAFSLSCFGMGILLIAVLVLLLHFINQ
jgi:hypothetical protein